LRSPAYRRISALRVFRRSLTAVNQCCDPFDAPPLVSGLKPVIARRTWRPTTFYPLAPGQPHPACALRRNLVREHAPSGKPVTSV